MTKQEAITEFGEEIVDMASGFYETDFDKDFFFHLDDDEQREYLGKAKVIYQRNLIKQSTKRHPNKANREAEEIIVNALLDNIRMVNLNLVAKAIIARLAENHLLIFHEDEIPENLL